MAGKWYVIGFVIAFVYFYVYAVNYIRGVRADDLDPVTGVQDLLDRIERSRNLDEHDVAGDRIARRSTSGGLMQIGTHLIQSWSGTQAVIALSSAEAELYANFITW